MASERLKGILVGLVLVGGILFGVKAFQEYRYYQTLKVQHQVMEKFLLEPIGKKSDGSALPRKDFLEAIIVEVAKAQQKGIPNGQ